MYIYNFIYQEWGRENVRARCGYINRYLTRLGSAFDAILNKLFFSFDQFNLAVRLTLQFCHCICSPCNSFLSRSLSSLERCSKSRKSEQIADVA